MSYHNVDAKKYHPSTSKKLHINAIIHCEELQVVKLLGLFMLLKSSQNQKKYTTETTYIPVQSKESVCYFITHTTYVSQA